MAEKKKKGVDVAAILGAAPDVSKSDPKQGPLAFAYADIDSIHPDPYNAKVYELSDLDGLMDAILLEGGLQQPIYVVPDGDSWTVKSGHRRHAALAALVKGSDKQPPHPELRSVPIVYRPNSDAEDLTRIADGDLDDDKAKELTRLMGELRVLIGNMGNRKQTSAELSAAAKELEDHYAALAELGVRFPGRLRDRVAAACNTSASKLARLKVIRDKLTPEKFVRAWEAGDLPEQSAYALAQMPAMLQEAVAEVYTGEGTPNGWRLEDVKKAGMAHYLSTKTKCPSGEGCTNGKGFLAHDLDTKKYDGVGECGCCVTCFSVTSCKYACPAGKEAAKKRRSEARTKNANQRAAAEKRIRTRTDFNEEFVKRVAAACEGDEGVYNAAINAIDPDALMTCYSEMHHSIPYMAFKGDKGQVSNILNLPVDMLAALCRRLNVSADYLLGLADDPMTQLAATAPAEVTPVATGDKPRWMPGDKPPREYMTCYCKFVDPQGFDYTLEARWLAMEGRWEYPADGEEITDKCLGWYPIPDDDDDNEEVDEP